MPQTVVLRSTRIHPPYRGRKRRSRDAVTGVSQRVLAWFLGLAWLLFMPPVVHAACDDPPGRGVFWSGCDLREWDLRGVDLRGATLTRIDLRGADLREANLSGADLGFARLDGARLGAAVLLDARLVSASLTGADASGAVDTLDALTTLEVE